MNVNRELCLMDRKGRESNAINDESRIMFS
jgi:hypothetical protein